MDETSESPRQKARAFILREAAELNAVLGDEDELAPILLRFHLLTEYMLDRLISASLKRGDRILDEAWISYHQKLILVHSMDTVPDEAIASLRQLNKVRNILSHQLRAKISPSHIESIGRPYGAKFSEVQAKHSDDVRGLLVQTFMLSWFDLVWELTNTAKQAPTSTAQ